jgi:antitoxin ParD1/3/4
MPSRDSLGPHFDDFVEGQLSGGPDNNASAAPRDAPRLKEERERRLATLDASIARGLADIEAGRVHEADDVFQEIEAELAALSDDSPV